MNWIIEKDLFPEYEDKLIDAVKKYSHSPLLLDYDHMVESVKDLIKYQSTNPLVFYGSLQLGRRLLRETDYYPGVFLTVDNYEVFKYYGYYGEDLLNNRYILCGLNDVARRKNELFDTFGTEGLFIRPSNGYKTFTGQVLDRDNFDVEFDTMIKSYGGLDLDQLVLIAPKKGIVREFRFVVVDGKVITGSMYSDKESRKNWTAYYDKPCDDQKAFEFVESLVDKYHPDPAFTMDIALTESNEYKLIEINSLCCASLYGCDYDSVVKSVSELSENMFYDVFNHSGEFK